MSGIICFDYLGNGYDWSDSLWLLLLAIFAILILSFRIKNAPLRKSFPFLLAIFWFCAGGIQWSKTDETLARSYFEKQYVTGDKLLVQVKEVAPTSNPRYTKVVGEVVAVIEDFDTLQTTGKALFYLENTEREVKDHQFLLVQSQITKIQNANNPGEFDAVHYWKYQGIHASTFVASSNYLILSEGNSSVFDVFPKVQSNLSSLIDKYLSGQEAAIGKGLILGDRSSIAGETTRMFANTGVSHILAVSGMHIAFLVLILNYLLQRFPRYLSKRNAAIISLTVVWLYALITGFSPSVARAAWMFTLISGSIIIGRSYRPVNGLLFSALIILIFNPNALFDIGFQLSYAAMIGIYTFFPLLEKQLYFRKKWLQSLWEGTALGIAAQIFTTPIALYFFHQFPNYFMLTNLALGMYSLVILVVGITLFSFSWLAPIAKLIGMLLYGILLSMLWIIRFVNDLPQSVSEGFVLSVPIVILLYILITLVFWSISHHRMRWLVGTLSITLLVVGSIVYQRFERMNSRKLTIFNSNKTLLVLKEKDRQVVIYDKQRAKKKQIDRLLMSFNQVFPTEKSDTVYLSNEKAQNITLNHSKLTIFPQKGGYLIQIGQKNYFLAYNNSYALNRYAKIITMPYMNDPTTFYSLKNGAFIADLED